MSEAATTSTDESPVVEHSPAADPLNAKIVGREDLNPELFIIRVAHEEGDVPEFEPGQFSMLGMPADPSTEKEGETVRRNPKRRKMTKRAYSIASSPKVREYMEFYIVVIEDGALTPKLFKMQVGDRLWMDKRISGKFTLDPVPPGKDLIMISTGTGLAPYLSMMHTYRGQERWRRFIIVHGCRYAADLGYKEELERIAAEDPTIYYFPMVTREPEDGGWEGLHGRVPTFLEPDTYKEHVGAELDPEDCHVFLCGNPDMIVQIEEELGERGFKAHSKKEPGNLHFEKYW